MLGVGDPGALARAHVSVPASTDVDPDALFPPVEFPAPRGTPLISPYIKWEHSQSWDVPAAEDFPNGSSSSSATVYTIGELGAPPRGGWAGPRGALRPVPAHRHQP